MTNNENILLKLVYELRGPYIGSCNTLFWMLLTSIFLLPPVGVMGLGAHHPGITSQTPGFFPNAWDYISNTILTIKTESHCLVNYCLNLFFIFLRT
jgi:hypothetical protein